MLSGPARTRIVATELFHKLLIAVYEPDTALDLGFRGEAFSALAGNLESTIGRCVWFS
jgi:hypothetical protein